MRVQSRFPEWGIISDVVTGAPARKLIEKADDWNADSIFVGTRGLENSFERFRLSSVSFAVATNAHCSVEVVRPNNTLQE